MKKRILAGLGFALGLMLLAVPAWAGDAEVGMVDGDSGEWHVREPNGSDRNFFYGNPGDIPLIGDWDCDGVETPGMFRPGSGFVYLTNGNPADNGVALGEIFYYFGIPGDIPIAGDWDGDGCDSPGIYRNGQVFLRDKLSTGFANRAFYFGVPGDRPFAGDWDGDGIDTVGIYRNGTGQIFYTNENPVSGVATTANDFFYGIPSDEFIPGDWDGDGIETVGIYRSSESRFYLRNENSTGTADESFVFGQEGWLPIGGDTELRDASLTASTGLLDFGAVGLDGTGTATLTVNFNGDGGDADLRITSIEFDQPGANFSAAPLTDPDIGFGESRAIEVSMAPTFLGVKRGSIRISHSGTNSPLIVDLIGRASHRVNAGGDPIDDWRADSPFSPGGNIGPLAGTSVSGPTAPDEVFESYRFGQQAWDFSVWPGSYRVNLYFAETFLDSAGARLFDVSIEGVEVLTGFDIYDAAGGKNRGIVRGFDIVSDANLDIDFTEIVNSPAIQGIEIVPMPVLKGLGSTPSEVVFGSTAVGDTLTRTITIVHLGEPTTGSVNVPGVSIVGDDAAQFAIVSGAGARTVTSGNPFDVVVEFRPTTAGVFDAQLFISHSGTNSPLRVDLSGAADNVIVYRLNTGGDAIVGQTSWSPDEAYIVPGTPSGEFAIVSAIDTSDQSLPPGTPIAMIRTERFGSSQVPLSYDLPVPNGPYEVRLYFVESVHTAAGVRVFDVRLEGNLAINDLDIFARAGKDKAIMIPRQANVTDGVLDIDLSPIAGKNLPAIHGIEIIKKEGNAFLSVDPVSLTLGPIVTSGTTTANVEVSHDGGAGIPSILIQSVSITGPDSGRFTLLSGPSANDVLPPGTSDMAQIRFTPGVIGDKAANLTIQYNGGRLITVPLVGSVNNAPVMANPGTRTGTEGVTFSVTGTATDPDTAGDGDFRTVTAAGLPSWASVTASGDGTITIGGTPGFADAGSSAVTLTVTDPDGLTDSETFTISIANFNRPPTFNESLVDQTNSEGEVVSISTEATDLDGDDLTWSATGLPGGTTISPASGLIGGTIGFNAGNADPGVYNVTVTVTDNGAPNKSATDSFTWTVNDFNQAPVFNQNLLNRTNPEGLAVSIPSPATDLDGDGLVYSATNLPGGVSINPTSGLISGTIGFNAGNANPGVYNVTVTVTDNGSPNKSDTDTFTWTVTNFNRPPTFNQNLLNRTNPEGLAVSIPSPATDLDGDGLVYSATNLPGGVSINPTSGLISGTIGFNAGNANPGVYNVTVTVTDNGSPNKSDTDTFTWTVTNVNLAPTAIATVPGSGLEGVAVAFTGAGTDPDGTIAGYLWDFGDALTSTLQNPSHVYAAAGTYNGSLIVTDNGGATSAPDPFTIVIGDRFTLTAFLGGTGSGSIVSVPAGINCPGDCDQLYPDGTSVTVTATPAGGSTFTGWTGSGCVAAGTGPCTIIVDADKGFTAIFSDINDPPTAIATVPGSGLEGVAVAFTGAGTDPDGTIAGYLWDFGDALTSTLQNPSHVYAAAGTYNGSLIVTDNGGATSAPDPFTIVIGDRFTLTAFLGGTGSGSIVSVPAGINCPGDCDQLYPDGTSVTVTATPAGGSTFTGWTGSGCVAAGTGPCTIIVDADKGFTAIFSDINDPPTAIATVPGSGLEGVAVAFTGAGTDPDGTIAGYLWDFGDALTSTLQNPSHVYAAAGTYNGSLIVTDNGGATSAPDPFTIVIGDRFTLTAFLGGTGSGSIVSVPAGINCPGDCDQLYPDGTSVTVTATPAGGSTFTGWTGSGCVAAGTGPCTIIVDADKGFTAIFSDINDPPTAIATVPGSGLEGVAVAFTGAGTDPDGTIAGYLWDFGDALTSTLQNPSHVYAAAGTYNGSLIVTDNGGATSAPDPFTIVIGDRFTLTAFLGGTGSGSIVSVPAGINCPGDCDQLYPDGTSVTVTATPAGGSTFTGWTGSGCVAAGTGPCTIIVDADKGFTAIFSDINDPPVPSAAPNPIGATEDGPGVGFVVSANDPDGPGAACSVSVAASKGTASFTGTDCSTGVYTPSAGQTGADSFTVLVNDGGSPNQSGTVVVNVNIGAVNDPPVPSAAPNPIGATEDGPGVGFVVSANDPDGPGAACSVSVAASKGTASFTGTDCSTGVYTPSAGQTGADSFTVLVNDGGSPNQSGTVVVNVNIGAVNDPPVPSAAPNPIGATEDGPGVGFVVSANDPDGPGAACSVSVAASKGTASFTGTDCSTGVYTPSAGQTGADSFTVLVNDGGSPNQSGTVVVNVNIGAVNDPPVPSAAPNPIGATEDGPGVGFVVSANDPDGPGAACSVSVAASKGTASFTGTDCSTGVYTPSAGQTGADSFTVLVNDGGSPNQSGTVVVNVNIGAVNDPPVPSAAPNPIGATEDGPGVGFVVSANDPDGPGAACSVSVAASKGTASFTGTDCSTGVYTPSAGQTGADSFTVLVNDGGSPNQSGTVVVNVNIGAVNDPPVPSAAPNPIGATEDGPGVGFVVSANDPDGPGAACSVSVAASKGTASFTGTDCSTGVYTPSAGQTGADSFTVLVNDGGSPNQSGTVVVNVNINALPVVQDPGPQTASVGVLFSLVVTATDDGSISTMAASTLPVWLIPTDQGGGSLLIEGTPTAGDIGPNAVGVTATDNLGSTSATVLFDITVS